MLTPERALAMLYAALCVRIDARANAALADRSLAEHARRSLGQRARWIAHDFKLEPR